MSGPGPPRRPGARLPPPPPPDEWRRLEPLVDAVLDAPHDRRAALAAELSGGDAALRAELERLVAECERAYPLLERPAAERFADVLDEAMPPLPESIAGRYRVLREIGRGGMAVVHLARDLKHGRDVAVKIVRPELAANMGRVRFLHEIEIAARLRHPHIVPLYDSGEVAIGDGPGASLLYYVMPYEAGHSLRERLECDGPLPVDDVVVILRDVCDALAHAHQHGIVHRDVKPDNVLLAGRHALVSDFGVARAVTAATIDATVGAGSTALGTPTYMAPEQAANDARVDHRADIYAVGVLAYELLAGRPPFADGAPRLRAPADVTDAMAELARQRADVPAALVAVVAACLAPRPDDRWQSADALLAQLAPIGAATPAAPAGARPRTPTRAALVAAAVGAASLVVLVVAASRTRSERPALVLGRASRLTSERGLEVQPSISPDGRHVAYAVGHSQQMRIAVRPVGGGPATWLTGDSTASEWLPRWSPDGSRLLFLSRGGVSSAPAFGGSARPEVAARPGAPVRSATWSADGREIAYVRGDSLVARTVGSGRTRLITTAPDLHSCVWSPDGARLACVSGNSFYTTVGVVSGIGPMFGNLAPSRIVLVPSGGGDAVSVTDSVSLHQSPAWSRDGRTLYFVSNRHGPRDVYALEVQARPAAGGEPTRVTTGMGVQSIGFSADGARLAYAAYSSTANVWAIPIPADARAASAASAASATPVTSGNQTVEGVRISFDGRWLVYDSDLSGNSDVYRVPVDGGDVERLTRAPSDEFRGTISPDGRELAYHSFQSGSRNVFVLPIDGGPVRQLTRSSDQLAMANWSPDGTALALFSMTTSEVLVMRRDAHGRWTAPRFVGGRGWRAEWSPDGRTIAFVRPADGRIGIVAADSGAMRDLYVPGAGDPPAELAAFAANGRELYFKSHDASGRASFWSIPAAGGRPRLLVRFDDPTWSSNRFDFASDGRRFYFTIEDRQSDVWVAEVARR